MTWFTVTTDGTPVRSSPKVIGDAKDYVPPLERARLEIEALQYGRPAPKFVQTNIVGLLRNGDRFAGSYEQDGFRAGVSASVGEGWIASKFLVADEEGSFGGVLPRPSSPNGKGLGAVVLAGLAVGAFVLWKVLK